MASLSNIIKLENQLANCEMRYKGLAIFPKCIENRQYSTFTPEERKHLTRKGFRWKIVYKFLNPDTKQYESFSETFEVNREFKNFKDRYTVIKRYFKSVKKHLDNGFSPFEENLKETSNNQMTVEKAFRIGIESRIKEGKKNTTIKDYQNRIDKFYEYLYNKGVIYISDVDKKVTTSFLDQFNNKNSNNFKSAISSIFSVLSNKDIIPSNFIKELDNKKIEKKSIRIYTEDEVNHIFSLLKENDVNLYMYVKMISYTFWRPIEICRMTIDVIDFENNLIREDSKTKIGKTKIIPSIILDDLKSFCEGKQGVLFSPYESGEWEAKDTDRRGYYTTRFRKFRNKFNLDPEIKMYQFRHTYISKAYLKLREKLSIDDSIKKLSLITGHESSAIKAYIQVNDIELPEDYSYLL